MARSAKHHPNDESREPKLLLEQLEEDLEQLRIAYEKYFLGIDKTAPKHLRDKVAHEVRQLMKLQLRSTVLRFRLQGLRARLVTYEHYWNRILDQIEKGTYRRDLAKLARREQRLGEDSTAAGDLSPAAEPSDPLDGLEPNPPDSDATPSERGRAVSRTMPGGFTEPELRMVYAELIAAKRAAGEDTERFTFEALVRTLARELPKMQQKLGGANVRIELARQGTKVRLRVRSERP